MGMPQPTFEYWRTGDAAARRAHAMIGDMARPRLRSAAGSPASCRSSSRRGHRCTSRRRHGWARATTASRSSSSELRHWGFENLYVAGCSTFPEKSACNPTLTAAAIAVRSANARSRGTRAQRLARAGLAMTADEARDVRIAASPINWHNDDFPILGSLTSVDAILAGMQAAGMDGTELGSLFPTTQAADLQPYLLETTAARARRRLVQRLPADAGEEGGGRAVVGFVEFLEAMGRRSSRPPSAPTARSSRSRRALRAALRLARAAAVPVPAARTHARSVDEARKGGLQELSEIAAGTGDRSSGYHPHMQTVVQSAEQLAMLADAAPGFGFTIDGPSRGSPARTRSRYSRPTSTGRCTCTSRTSATTSPTSRAPARCRSRGP